MLNIKYLFIIIETYKWDSAKNVKHTFNIFCSNNAFQTKLRVSKSHNVIFFSICFISFYCIYDQRENKIRGVFSFSYHYTRLDVQGTRCTGEISNTSLLPRQYYVSPGYMTHRERERIKRLNTLSPQFPASHHDRKIRAMNTLRDNKTRCVRVTGGTVKARALACVCNK